MAELLTLAELTIDSSGVVSGFAVVRHAVAQTEPPIIRFAENTKKTHGPVDALVGRMFNLKMAVTALLGGFTGAGLIFAMKDFAEKALMANASSGKLVASWERLSSDMAKMLGNLPGISTGLEGIATWLDRIDRVMVRMKDVSENPAVSTVGAINKFLFGLTGPGLTLRVIEQAGKLIDKVLPPAAQAGKDYIDKDAIDTWEAALKAQDQSNAYYQTARPLSLGPNFRMMGGKAIGVSPAQRIDEMEAGLGPLGTWWSTEIPDDDALERWEKALELQDRHNEFWETLPDKIGPALEAVHALEDTYSNLGNVAGAASEAIGAAAQAGVISQGAAAKAMIAFQAGMATIRGMFELAEAAASAAIFDYRGAVLHKIAAGLFFATAAFHAAGAFGSGGSTGGVGTASGGGAPQEPSGRPREIVFVNNGFAFVNKDQLVRWVTEEQRRSGDR